MFYTHISAYKSHFSISPKRVHSVEIFLTAVVFDLKKVAERPVKILDPCGEEAVTVYNYAGAVPDRFGNGLVKPVGA